MLRRDLKNILILIIPAIVCVLVFLLPVNFQEKLILKMLSLNFWSWFTYIFVHQNFNHLFFNLLFYVPTIFLVYTLLHSNEKKKFYKIFIISIVLVPLLTLILTTMMHKAHLIPLFANSRGFSGISSMALGMLTFAISRRLQERWANKQKIFLLDICYLIFIPSLAIMIFNLSYKFALFIFIVWGLAILNFAHHIRKNKLSLRIIKTKELLPILLIFVFLLMGVSLLIPVNIVKDEVITNTLAHLFGYIIGFLIIFIYHFKN